eukprot:4951036-Amphidinium_carterae.1
MGVSRFLREVSNQSKQELDHIMPMPFRVVPALKLMNSAMTETNMGKDKENNQLLNAGHRKHLPCPNCFNVQCNTRFGRSPNRAQLFSDFKRNVTKDVI